MGADKRDGFFAIDLGAFRCALVGGLNSGIAHLIMARGTFRDNTTTRWSVNAIEKRTNISRPNAAKAVQDLVKRGIWQKTRDGRYPTYKAVPGDDIPGATPTDKPVAVWLPNALIDGAADEVPPVELIRQTRSLPALRLLVELYAVQYLPDHGGVPRDLLKGTFDRGKVGEQGPFVVWGFRSKATSAGHPLFSLFHTGQMEKREDGTKRDAGIQAAFWPAVHTLEDLGLVEKVGMLLDGDDDAAEVIHPYATGDNGEPIERELAQAAHLAALGMITEGQRIRAEENGYEHLAPVRRHIANATLVEVYRLRYRPHTSVTAKWYALMQTNAAEHLAQYQAPGRTADEEQRAPVLATERDRGVS